MSRVYLHLIRSGHAYQLNIERRIGKIERYNIHFCILLLIGLHLSQIHNAFPWQPDREISPRFTTFINLGFVDSHSLNLHFSRCVGLSIPAGTKRP